MRVAAEGLTFSYGRGAPVVDGFCESFDSGSSTAIVGPSGRGKSTLLALLGLELQPQAGTVFFDGKATVSRTERSNVRGTIAWIFQGVSILPRLSVVENVAVGAYGRGVSHRDADREAREALDVVGLAKYAEVEARRLSGGEAQRVGVARVLVSSARLVLADEPTANLDSSTAHEVAAALVAKHGREQTVILATHDLDVASLCDRTIAVGDEPGVPER